MAKESLEKGNEADMILALKALGNAGHTGSIKTISRFLPGVSANPVNMNSRVLSAAVQSLRHIAAKDPHQVRTTFFRTNKGHRGLKSMHSFHSNGVVKANILFVNRAY